MLQSFRPQDFIHLPPLGEAGTLSLVDELERAAKTVPKLPSPIVAALSRVLESMAELKKTIGVRERSGSQADPKARAADRALDDAWGAFQSWLLGWTRLPDRAHPRVTDARTLYAGLFPKGLQFLTLDFKDEWTESQNRLEEITSNHLDELIDALGGGAFLQTIAKAHKVYGEALHITAGSTGMPEPDAHVRRALDSTHMALREYVAQVAATVRRNETDSVGMAARLLGPISDRAVQEDEYTITSQAEIEIEITSR
jgi:hypothetical protein